jgi:hypothetical protein
MRGKYPAEVGFGRRKTNMTRRKIGFSDVSI